jgi:hypothetical protein
MRKAAPAIAMDLLTESSPTEWDDGGGHRMTELYIEGTVFVNMQRVTSITRMRTIGVITTAMIALAACQATGSGQPSGGQGDPTPTPSATVVTGPTPAAHFTMITLRRVGGFAGFSDHVTVDAKGAWTKTDKSGKTTTGTLTAGQLDSLVAYAADPQLSKEATRGQKTTKCSDSFTYVLTVDSLSVGYVDCPTDGEMPQVATKIVSLLAQAGAV